MRTPEHRLADLRAACASIWNGVDLIALPDHTEPADARCRARRPDRRQSHGRAS